MNKRALLGLAAGLAVLGLLVAILVICQKETRDDIRRVYDSVGNPRVKQLESYTKAMYAPEDKMPRDGLNPGMAVLIIDDPGSTYPERRVEVKIDEGIASGAVASVPRNTLLPQ